MDTSFKIDVCLLAIIMALHVNGKEKTLELALLGGLIGHLLWTATHRVDKDYSEDDELWPRKNSDSASRTHRNSTKNLISGTEDLILLSWGLTCSICMSTGRLRGINSGFSMPRHKYSECQGSGSRLFSPPFSTRLVPGSGIS